MSTENPFAAPQSDLAPDPFVPPQGEVWRSGKELVFTHGAELPVRCIKCNATDDLTMTTRTVYYYPRWVFLLVLVNLIVLAIVAMIARKKATVGVCLCQACRGRRRNAILLAWLCVLTAIASIVSMIFVNEFWVVPLLVASVLLFIASLVIGIGWGQLVTVRKIDKVQVRLIQISAAYLDMLPVGP